MNEKERVRLGRALSSLCVFRGVSETCALVSLRAFLTTGDLEAYGAFVHGLCADGCSLSEYLLRTLLSDENPYIAAAAQGKELPAVLRENAGAELSVLSRLTHLTPEELCADADSDYLPRFDNTPTDLAAVYADRLSKLHRFGYGIFSTAGMFRLRNDEIVPVTAADPILPEQFVGYDDARRQVLDNTRALLEGRPAANLLLYGDAGTGKSSTVKACANLLRDEGIRLIELRKDQLHMLPYVMGRIKDQPLKFILFIDDLSFTKNDDSFSMLKAALEGSASAKAPNAVIYATSNRRHIVKETFGDRAGDDVHRGDTLQELMSLSDRFGKTVYFPKPDKQLYLSIVRALAEKQGVRVPTPELETAAEAFALRKGGRSPRAAEQFIHSLLAERPSSCLQNP